MTQLFTYIDVLKKKFATSFLAEVVHVKDGSTIEKDSLKLVLNLELKQNPATYNPFCFILFILNLLILEKRLIEKFKLINNDMGFPSSK